MKTILNGLVAKMVTRARVLKVIGNELSSRADAFASDFIKEGWCKKEYGSILHTLFHLNQSLADYAIYWF